METVSKKIVKGSELEKKMGLGEQVSRKQSSSASTAVVGRGIISKGELSSQERAQALIAEAEAIAARIKEEAQKLLSEVKEETEKAKKKGYSEGKEEGMAEWTEEILKTRTLREEFFSSAEPDVIKLVLSIAEKIIGKLAEEHTEIIRSIVRQALEHSLGDRIVVKIHPEDLKRLKAEDLQFKDLLDRTKQLHFKEEESIQKGGCVVETEIGTIDAQLETQLKAIRKALGV